MKKTILASGIALLMVEFVIAQSYQCSGVGGMGAMMSGAYGFGFAWIFGWVFAILVLTALVLLIVWLTKQIQKGKKK